MFSGKTSTINRLKADDDIVYTINEGELTLKAWEVLARIFNHKDSDEWCVDEWQNFLNDNEFIYDELRQCVMFIVRNARIRVRKYFYMPPIYVAFPIHNEIGFNIQNQKLRYFQKIEAYSIALNEEEEKAYELNKYPWMVAYHPHIDGKGHACYGHWGENLETAKTMGPYAYVETIRGYLNDYNGRSTFFRIDPYSFDRNDELGRHLRNRQYTSVPFPVQTDYIRFGDGLKTSQMDEILTNMVNKEWLLELCEQNELNYQLYWELWTILCSSGNENDGNWDQEVFKVLRHNNISFDYEEVVLHPMHYRTSDVSEEQWKSQMDKYEEYQAFMKPYQVATISTYIFEYLYSKLGHKFSKGELNVFLKAYAVTYDFNYEVHKKEFLSTCVTIRRNNLEFGRLLNNFGFENSYLSVEFKLLVLLINNNDYSNLIHKTRKWLNLLSLTSDKIIWEQSYRDFNEYLNHTYSYDELRAKKLILERPYVTFERESIMVGNYEYMLSSKNPLEASYYKILRGIANALSNKIAREGDSLLTYQIVSNYLKNINNDINWAEEFKEAKTSDKDMFKNSFLSMIKHYGVSIPPSGRDFIRDTFEKKEIDFSYDDEDDRGYDWFDFMMHTPRELEYHDVSDESILEFIDSFYKAFPEFPTKVSEVKDFINMLDKITLKTAYDYALNEHNKLKKELTYVLKNTFQSVYQGELFSEEVPIN